MSQLEAMLNKKVAVDGSMKVGHDPLRSELSRLFKDGRLLELNLGTNRVREFAQHSKPEVVASQTTQYLIVPGGEPEVWKVDPSWTGQVSVKRVQDEEILAQIKDYAQRLWEVADRLY